MNDPAGILAVSYCFPPLPYPRSIQVARLLSHLTTAPVRVLRGDEPRADEQLLALCAPKLEIDALAWPPSARLARRLRRHLLAERLLVPDAGRPWAAAASRRIATRSGEVLITFGQPMSDHLVGLRVARQRGVPWIAHFSDPWVDSPYRRMGAIAEQLNRRLECRVIQRAEAVVFTSPETAELVMDKYPASWTARAHVVPHAFDPDLYERLPASADQRPTLRYLGNFYGRRGPEPLFEGLAILAAKRPALANEMRVELVGRWEAPLEPSAAFRALPAGLVTVRPPVGYLDSLALMRASRLLLVLDAPATRSLFLPSKLIDYMGARRPILAVSPPGPSATLVRELGGWVAAPEDPQAVAAAIDTALAEPDRYDWGDDTVRSRYTASAVAARMDAIVATVRAAQRGLGQPPR